LLAEAMALLEGVQFGLSLGYPSIVFESDFLVLISKLNSHDLDISEFGSIVDSIRSFVSSFVSVSFRHVSRGGNIPAHLLT